MKIQCEREQIQLQSLSDQELAAKLSVRPERWASAVQSHRASQVADLFASPGEPASFCAEDEHLDWLRSVLHQVEVKTGIVLHAHLIEGKSLKDLTQALKCSRSSLRLYLNEGLELLRRWAHRDGLMPFHTS